MTTSRDPDRMIRAFVIEGQEHLNDQVYDAVRAEIELKQQRVVIGPWRLPTMNRLVPIGLGAAAVVVALIVGANLLAPPAPGGVGANPTSVPSPTPTAAVAEPTSTPESFLPEGPFTVVDTGAPAVGPRITVTIPAPGWTSMPDFGGLLKGPDADPPQSAMLFWAWPAGTTLDVYGDPCEWASAHTVASTVDEAAAALAAQASRDASDPVDVTVDGYAGKHLTLHVPNDAATRADAFADCDQKMFASYGVSGGEPTRTHQGPGQVDELWILDVDGSIAIIDAMYRADTAADRIEEMRAIAESATFEAP